MTTRRPPLPSTGSLLEQVLPKLRPFQREALEFATTGGKLLCDRQQQQQQQRAGTTSTSSGTGSGDGSTNRNTNRNDTNETKQQNDDDDDSGSTKMLLADEMGLGKTVTSLAIMAYYESEWPLLILCPASLRYVDLT